MIIVVDNREQHPFTFQGIKPSKEAPAPKIVNGTLHTGDYSLQGYEDLITIERKSLVDLYSTFGKGRERFERELERMSHMKFAGVAIEAGWDEILNRPPSRSKLPPKVIFVSITVWEQRYGVHFWPCENRELAERKTYRALERFWRDMRDGKQ